MTPAISARFATSADTTWLSAMTFLDLVKSEVDYRHYTHDVSARRLVRWRHDAAIKPAIGRAIRQ
jgi:hypothetical protein